MLKRQSLTLFISRLALVFAWLLVPVTGTASQIERGGMAG